MVYFLQRVAIDPHRKYAVSLDRRASSPNARLQLMLCEQFLLYSAGCTEAMLKPIRSPGWERVEATVVSTTLAEGYWPFRRPVVLALTNVQAGTLLDVTDVSLRDESGQELIRNPTFSDRGAHWFFTGSDFWMWHPESTWVQLRFEQGWIGLIAFAALFAMAYMLSVRRARRGDAVAIALVGSLTGLLVVVSLNSVLEFPRVALLMFLLLLLACVKKD